VLGSIHIPNLKLILWVSGINLGSIYLSKKEIQINNAPNGWVICMA
jgi:hypothetical protein